MNIKNVLLSYYKKGNTKLVTDMVINIVGNGLTLAVLNLIAYPILAQLMPIDLYGQMQATVSMVYLIGSSFGTTLASTRLVLEYNYNDKRVKGDFNFIFLCCTLLLFIISFIVVKVYFKDIDLVDCLLITLICLLNYFVGYYVVGLRLKVNYNAIFCGQLLRCLGFAIGLFAFQYIRKWALVFIISYVIVLIYYIVKTDIINEPYHRTFLFCNTLRTYCNLIIASLLGKGVTYFDKLLIYPLLGGEAVTIYYVSCIFGKIIIKITDPISNVILSYLAKCKMISRELWKKVILITLIGSIMVFVICLVISPIIIKFLYPQWYSAAIEFIPICTFCLSVSSYVSIIYPFTLKSFDSSIQIIVNAISLVIYVMLFLFLYQKYGLYSCCYAILVSQLTKLLMIMFFCLRSFRNAD